MVSNQIRTMIWIQIVCRGYQQTRKFAASNEIVNGCVKCFTMNFILKDAIKMEKKTIKQLIKPRT